jgi:drug/metabolite transporter, DME family
MLGASLWGTISWYVRHLYEFGFTPMEIVILQVWTGRFFITSLFNYFYSTKNKASAFKDIRYFIGTGTFSIFLNFCVFTAIAT